MELPITMLGDIQVYNKKEYTIRFSCTPFSV